MTQQLTGWEGDVASLIAEMKRRAGVRTDQDLARYMGASQSTVSNWRKRGAVPEAAILQYEEANKDPDGVRYSRSLAARAVALRLPELWYSSLKSDPPRYRRQVIYRTIAYSFNAIVAEIAQQMERIEGETGRSTEDLLPMLLEDDLFLNGIIDWVRVAPLAEMAQREAAATRAALRA